MIPAPTRIDIVAKIRFMETRLLPIETIRAKQGGFARIAFKKQFKLLGDRVA